MPRIREGDEGVYLVDETPLADDQVPAGLRDRLKDPGAHGVLRIAVWYTVSEPRGLKLSVVRMVRDDSSEVSILAAAQNCYRHLLTLARKNDRRGMDVAAIVRENLDEIRRFAVADDAPDWGELASRLRERIETRLAA